MRLAYETVAKSRDESLREPWTCSKDVADVTSVYDRNAAYTPLAICVFRPSNSNITINI